MNSAPNNLYRQGGEDGLKMGIVFIVIFVFFTLTLTSALSILLFAGMLYVPYLLYKKMKQLWVRGHGMLSFSAVWTYGVVVMICASLILTLFTYIYFRWINPTFWIATIDSMQATLAASASSPQEQEQMSQIIEQMKMLQFAGAMNWAMSFGWMTSFSGCVLALILTPFVRHNLPPRRPEESYPADNTDASEQ